MRSGSRRLGEVRVRSGKLRLGWVGLSKANLAG